MELVVTANVNDLLNKIFQSKKSLGDFQAQLKRFKDALATTTDANAFQRLSRAIDATEKKIKLLQQTSSSVASGITKIAPGANQASNALTNLGRVAQDAPFGFIGIQNNINPLLESFQRLKTETGSSASAFKSLAKSLIGPAGLGLAVSIASALILEFGDEISDWINSTSNVEKAQKLLNKSLADSTASVQGQLAAFKAIVAVAQDVNQSDKARQEAIDKLNKEYDIFNNKLNLSNINTKESVSLINQQTASFIRQAKIKGLQNLITKEAEESAAAQISAAAAAKVNTQGINGLTNAMAKLTGYASIKAIDKSTERTNLYTEALNKLIAESANVGDLIIGGDANKAKKTGRDILTIAEVLKELNLELKALQAKEINLGTNEAESKIRAIQKAIDDLIKRVGLAPNNPLVLKLFTDIKDLKIDTLFLPQVKIPVKPQFVFDQKGFKNELQKNVIGGFTFGLNDNLKALQEFIKRATELTQEFKFSAIEGVGEAIALAITDGAQGLKSGIQAIFSLVGDFLIQLGKAAIAASKIGIAIKAAVANPAFGFAAGVAAIIAGNLIKNVIPKFATGVTNFGGGLALVGERGPELVNLPQGSDIIPNAQTNGLLGQNMVFIPAITIRGSDLVLAFNRAQATINRNG